LIINLEPIVPETITDQAQSNLIRSFMKSIILILFILNCFNLNVAQAAETLRIIPQPVSLTAGTEDFIFEANTKIQYTSAALADEAAHLEDFLKLRLNAVQSPNLDNTVATPNAVILHIDATQAYPEGYELNASTTSIIITGKDEAGVFYGIQTLKQMCPATFFKIPATKPASVKFTTASIIDYPRFGWRGNHIDLSRHWHGVADLKRMIDVMALQKMNRFQLHLTDDQGWRIQIDSFPKLQTEAAWREGNPATLPAEHFRADGKYGGYLTKADVAELVAYAKANHIELIPEIDLPGHLSAAWSVYPNVLNGSTDASGNVTQTNYGNLAPWDAESMDFFYKVFDEVSDMFPGKYIHLGGDEFSGYGGWKNDGNNFPEVGAWFTAESLRENGATGEPSGEKVHGWMFKKIQDRLVARRASQGGVTPRIIGWHETHEGDKSPPANTIAMQWIGTSASSANPQLANGYEVIMAQEWGMYYNYSIEDKTFFPGYGYVTKNTLEKAYNWVAVDPASTNQSNILGIQCSMWTEAIFDQWAWDYAIFPRLCATSEKGWSPLASKNFANFTDRLYNAHDDRLDAMGIGFSRNQPAISGLPQSKVLNGIHMKRAAFNDYLDIDLPAQSDNGDTYRYLWDNHTDIFSGYRFVIPETNIPVYQVESKMTANRTGTMAVSRQRRDGTGVSHPVHIQVAKAVVAPARLANTEAGMWYVKHTGNYSHGNALSFLRLPAAGEVKISALSELTSQAQNSALEVTAILDVTTAGVYGFKLTATGASTIRIGKMVLCTEGKEEDIYLKVGKYPITVTNVVGLSGTPSVQAQVRAPGGSYVNFGTSALIQRSTTFTPRASSLTVGKTASTSDSQSTTAGTDGNPNTNWAHSGQNVDAWLEVDLGSEKIINSYAIHVVGKSGYTLGGAAIAVSRIQIEYKNAANQWIPLTTDKTAIAAQICDLPSTKARYFRAHLVSPNANPGIAMFDLYGASQTGQLAFTSQPGKTTILPGGTAITSAATTEGSGNLSYQWYIGNSGDTSSPIAGQTSSQLNYTTTTATTANFNVWLRVTDSSNSIDSDTTLIEITNADRDGDGLSDIVETTLGTDPDLKDTDSDGTEDGLEHHLGTDPVSAINKPQLISMDFESGSNTFSGAQTTSGYGNNWNAMTGDFYTAGAMTDPEWSNLKLSDDTATSVDFAITGKVAFYNTGGNALLNDYLFIGAAGADSNASFTIKDLIPNRPYALLLHGSGTRDMPMTVNGQSGAAPANGHWLVKTTANAQGEITGTMTTPGGEKNLSGVQLLGRWLEVPADQDTDNDGISDQIEIALGHDDGVGATLPELISVNHDSKSKLAWSLNLTHSGADRLIIQYTTDLTATWKNVGTDPHPAIVSDKSLTSWKVYLEKDLETKVFLRLSMP